MPEKTEVVIVGSRCAGTAAAIALARRGRGVVALDSASFPSDTLSTHLFFTHHWAELELGARDEVMALGAPLHTQAGLGAPGVEVVGAPSVYAGLAAGGCVRRPGLDMALVETARRAGAEVRERVRVTDLLRDSSGRVSGCAIGSATVRRARSTPNSSSEPTGANRPSPGSLMPAPTTTGRTSA